MPGLLAGLAPAGWPRAPRPTARLRLTLLYGALFVVCGAALLTITYLLVEHAVGIVTLPGGAKFSFGKVTNPGPLSGSHQFQATYAGKHALNVTPSQLAQLRDEGTQLHAFDMHQLLVGSAIALGVMAVVSVALGWFVAGRVLRPVRIISATAREIGASNLNERLNLDGPDDEFRELASTLDGLLERLETSFDSQRRFVANASHELRTPLTLDRALLERALGRTEPDQEFWRTTCERLLASSQQQDRLVEALLTLARSESGVHRLESFELSSAIDDVLLSPEIDATGIPDLRVQAAGRPAPVTGDRRLVERLVRNLVDNAMRYNQPNGCVDITTRTDAGHAVLSVSNTGPTVADHDVDRLFQPFERLSPSRSGQRDGTGLGLSIVKAIADAHDATVAAIPRPGGGLNVEVTFPPVETGFRPSNDQRRPPPSGARTEASADAPEADPRKPDDLVASSTSTDSQR